ncbi:hypothetical protein DASC09_036650 [Saccharomycopsis crataegensis]|uniref:Uncharacterized protein n=1 Tax=Saccharomycopsis crataegensis TaxID=43959 RepID=A0AAV5QN40_9ASCO|nr:hypothetical protein DASC09_036650 [Saccharomycopsis crataegensis]
MNIVKAVEQTAVSSLFPALISLKVVNSNDRTLLRSWIKWLTIFLLIKSLEDSFILHRLPSPPKVAMVLFKVWIFNPLSQNYILIFNQFVQSSLSTQDQIEQKIPGPRKQIIKKKYNSNKLIFENQLEWFLELTHSILLKFGNAMFGFDNSRLRFHQRLIKNTIPIIYSFFENYYQILKSTKSEIEHLDRKYRKKLQQSFKGSIDTTCSKGEEEAINSFFSDLNTYDTSKKSKEKGKRTKSKRLLKQLNKISTNNGNSANVSQLKDSSGFDKANASVGSIIGNDSKPLEKNLYVEYLVRNFKERTNLSSLLNILLSVISFILSFTVNFFLLLFMKLTGRLNSKGQPKTGKKVSFVERAFSFSSLKGSKEPPSPKSKNENPSTLNIPKINLIPPTPQLFEVSDLSAVGPLPKIRRQHSKSVGAESTYSIAGLLSGKKDTACDANRRNSFKEFLKNPNRNNFSTLTRLGSSRNNSFEKFSESSFDKSIIVGRSRSNSHRMNNSLLAPASKVSTIEESSILDDTVDKDLFSKSLNDISATNRPPTAAFYNNNQYPTLLPLNTSSNISLVHDGDFLGSSEKEIVSSPVSLDSTDNNTPVGTLVADPFTAILNDKSEMYKIRDGYISSTLKNGTSEKRKSFMLFKKSHNDVPGIDFSLAKSSIDATRSSTDSRRDRKERNSIIELIKGTGLRSLSPNPPEIGKIDDKVSDGEANSKTKQQNDMNIDAYNKLVGRSLSSDSPNTPYISTKSSPESSTPKKSSNQSLHLSGASTTDNVLRTPPKLNFEEASKGINHKSHDRQQSNSSVGVKFIHSFTPNLKKIENMAGEISLDSESIDYLSYQHEHNPSHFQYSRSPLYIDQNDEVAGTIEMKNSISKRNSLKNKFKRLSNGKSKRSSIDSSREKNSHTIFKNKRNSVSSFVEEPCTY